MSNEITAWKVFFKVDKSLLSAFANGEASKHYRRNVRNWPKKGWPGLLCFETKEQAVEFVSNCYLEGRVWEVWEVKVFQCSLHEFCYRGSLAVGSFAIAKYADWPPGTIAAKYVKLVRKVA